MKHALNFSDVQIVPRTPTRPNHRSEVMTDTQIGRIRLAKPFIVPSMRSLVSPNMVCDVEHFGALAIQPRGMFVGEPLRVIAVNSSLTTAVDIAGQLIKALPEERILSIEIANGHMVRMGDTIKRVRDLYGENLAVWAGAVATCDGVEYLAACGADAAIIGIGVGSACATTRKTGVGVPMFQNILDCTNCSIPIISAGGCRNYGDVAKAIAAGADAVMVGALLAGCSDAADPPHYSGMSSRLEKQSNDYIEGFTRHVPLRSLSSVDIMRQILEGLRSSMSYCDAYTLSEFRANAEFVRIS